MYAIAAHRKATKNTSQSWYFSRTMKNIVGKRVFPYIIAIGISVGLFVVLNAGYFQAHLAFDIRQAANVVTSGNTTSSLSKNNAGVLSSTTSTKRQPNMVWVERLGINAPVIYTQKRTETAFQKALIDGVVHYPGTAMPGKLGNVYIFGHSSDYRWSKGKYKTVFALLTKIDVGDKILVTDDKGKVFSYHVIQKKVVKPSDSSVLSQFGYKKRLLTLQTSYPLGTALKRLIVLAELDTVSFGPAK